MTERLRAIPRRELAWLGGAMLLGLVIRLVYVFATAGDPLAGDELEYDIQGRFFADGQPFWSTTPFGDAHPSLWKAPGYTTWVGLWYSLLGTDPRSLLGLQAFLGPVTIGLTWLLGRRLFTPKVGLAAAAVVAVYPFAWQWETRLFSEALATPLMLVTLILFLDRPRESITAKRAALIGATLGLALLLRPTSFFVVAGVLLAFALTVGFKRGLAYTALAAVVAGLFLVPWTYRNFKVTGELVPISVQDAAAYGTFNDEAANDPDLPYAWRPYTERDRDLFRRPSDLNDGQLRAKLQDRAVEYVKQNPEAVPLAFFYNGISRLWDLRTPQEVIDEGRFQRRQDWLTALGLAAYWILLAGAIAGLIRHRRRRALVWPVLALALAASVAFTTVSATRYRAPLEPLIVVLAASALPALAPRRTVQDSGQPAV